MSAFPAIAQIDPLGAARAERYVLIGIAFEERDLVVQFGERYLAYRREVGMLLPRRPWR